MRFLSLDRKSSIYIYDKRLRQRPKPSPKMLGIFIGLSLFLVVGVFSPFSPIREYLTKQHRTPQALQSDQELPTGLASDATYHGKTSPQLSNTLLSQLQADKSQQLHGEKQDRRHVKVLNQERTEYAMTYLNADGSRTQEVSTQATSYKDAQGNWQTVDTTLIKGTDGKWYSKANAWQAVFGDSSQGLQLAKNGQQFSLIPSGGKTVPALVSGKAPDQKVTYKDVWPGVDLQYSLSGSQLKEDIIVKHQAATTQFDFISSGNLTAADNGQFNLTGEFEGFRIAAPTVSRHDSGLVTNQPVVDQALVGSDMIRVTLDASWLQQLEPAAFPVLIDPTVVNLGSNYQNVTSTGFICNPGQGCGNSVGHDAINNADWRFMYQLPVPAGGTNQVIANAVLHLEMTNPPDGFTGSEQIKVNRASCLNAFNCFDYAYGEASGTATTSGDIETSGLYRAAVNVGDTSPWLMVRGEEGGTTDKYKLFDNTKTKVTFTYETLPAPSLIDTSNPSLSVPQNGGITVTSQPTLASTVTSASDPDGPGPQRYRYVVGTSKMSLPSNPLNLIQSVTGTVADSGVLDSPQWVVPDGLLQDGTTYYWQALVWDGYATAPPPWVYSPIYSFKVDFRNGKDATQAYDDYGPVSVDYATGNVTTSGSTHSMNALGGNIGVSLEYNSPLRSRPGLVADYYNDPLATRNFPAPSVAPTTSRVDPNIKFDWGSGSPYSGVITSDNFLVRWTGWFVAPANGTYQFGTTSDNGSRIFINGSATAYIDAWSAGGTSLYGANVSLTAGQIVQIKYEFAEWTGNAKAEMLVKTTDGTTVTPRVIPTAWLQTGPRSIATPHGLVGRYYTDPFSTRTFPASPEDPSRLFLTRTDASLTQNWGSNSPAPNGPTDNFLVRWTGQFRAPLADTYTFGVGSDDGARVYINGTLVTDAWSDHGSTPIVYGPSGTSLTQGQLVNITVEYYERGGDAAMGLYVRQASLGSADIPVASSWLNPQAQILPDGWGLGLDVDGTLSYSYATINAGNVILYDADSQTHEYKFINGGFTPPIGETGQMIRNGDGTITLQDDDGLTYVFASNGTIQSVTRPSDDRNPAALQYTYGASSGSIPRLTQISDGVNTNRKLNVYYGGDANCPAAPSGFLAATQTSYICGATSTDGRTTGFFYTTGSSGPVLARISLPGNESTDYQYASDMLSAVRTSLANDAIQAGVRSQDGTELTALTYDGLGRVNKVQLPAATAGATRMAHNYDYLGGNQTRMRVSNATEPNGFTRKITYDGTYRTIADTDIANLTTNTEWDSLKDLVKSTTDAAGLKNTTLYDYADRITDQYGPAPAAWFDSNGLPLTTPTNYTPQVPHNQNIYEEGINGLAAAYYNLSEAANGTGTNTKVLFGNPKLHGTGVGPTNGDLVKTWGATPPYTPVGPSSWGASLTGWIHLTALGSHNFRAFSDDGVRVWIDDQLIINDWTDGGQRSHTAGSFTNSGNPTDHWYRIRVDYYNKASGGTPETDARLELYMTPPGGSETSALGSLLKPNYGLITTTKNFDSSTIGDSVTTNDYGPNPEFSLLYSSTVDPAGLNLTTTNTYETPGTAGSFLRKTSMALPGGATTNYAYYTATDTRDNPCTTSVTESILQAGLARLKTEPDPDGAGPKTSVTTESIFDDSGRVAATRFNTASWTCYTYDSRGRLTKKAIPSNENGSARSVNYEYAVNGNPLVSRNWQNSLSVQGIFTTTDLLGRTTKYQDQNSSGITPTTTTYDTIGRLTTRTGVMGTEEFVYDNLNRLTNQKLDTIGLATPTYDSFGRLQQVTYPRASQQKVVIGRDSLGRLNNLDYTLGNGTTHRIDTVTRSQSNRILSGTELTNAKSYSYDKAGRLTNATYGTNTYGYSYAAPSASTCNQTGVNLNANKSGNRTSQTVNGATTTYCYDQADRLIASSDTGLTTPKYDTHNNTKSLGQEITAKYLDFEYDSSDRPESIHQVFSQNYISQYEYDGLDRIVARFENQGNTKLWESWYGFTTNDSAPDYEMDPNWNVRERYIQLPGGVLFTVRSSASSFSSSSNVYSLPNVHGDTMVTNNGGGTQINTFSYEPFGKLSGTTQPDNANGKADFDHLGQYQKQTETLFGSQPQIMGARIYMSVMGRFNQVDPVEGGCSNAYTYVYGDPINTMDPTGTKTKCDELQDRISYLNEVMTKRYVELDQNAHNLTSDSTLGRKHLAKYRDTQQTLRNRIKEWDDNKCGGKGGGGGKLPSSARSWVTREAPELPRSSTPSFSFSIPAVDAAAIRNAAINTGFVIGGALAVYSYGFL